MLFLYKTRTHKHFAFTYASCINNGYDDDDDDDDDDDGDDDDRLYIVRY